VLQRILASCILVLLIAAEGAAETRRIAITFDDAPRVDGAYFDGPTRTTKLLAALEAAKVGQVAFFCNSTRMDAGGAVRIKSYAEAGHLIANHSHSHPDLQRRRVWKE
jgi:peptidoglycan/xylan/chitin deacetylase (PgdA/CDA1 family)